MMVWLSVAAGGAFGAMTRFGLSSWLTPEPGKFPIATFTANITGCFLMGVLYVVVMDKHVLPMAWRPFLMVGFLGAFTTFSTFSIEALGLWQTQHFSLALSYVLATMVVSILAVWSGYSLSEFVIK